MHVRQTRARQDCPEGAWEDPLTRKCIPEDEKAKVQGRRAAIVGAVVSGALYMAKREATL